ncbi:MAG: FtsW/RodA/SpoVE family cell cycle protein [Verrucomicrobia bacterium]|nr:FtsW/RodA/SpoVE family cell cycle protein [Verrucomicrobiota bacterium]
MNWAIILTMLALAIFGVVAIYSCTYMREAAAYHDMWRKQAGWIAFSSIIFVIVSLADYRWVRWGALPLYLASLVFLVLTLIMGKKLDGARSWLHIGPIQFQPAQLAVISGILIIALFLSQFKPLHPMWKMLACGMIAGAPALLILMQPDLGSTLVWGPVLFSMLFIGQIPKRYLISVFLIICTCLPLVYYFKLKPYQQARIVAFVDPEIDSKGSAWAVNQTMLAIGSGGWAGKGFKAPNSQVELGYVPQTTVPNDYIFAAIGEQWGFLGSTVLLVGFGILVGTCHTFQNIGMCISLMPVTGVPLPLISYSGSFVCVIMFSLGLVNSVWVHRKELP